MGNHSNINNMFVPYELALRLKELGFNEKCFDVYSDVKSVGMFRNSPRDRTPKILWQQAFHFFMTENNIIVVIDRSFGYSYSIHKDTHQFELIEKEGTFGSYEEARLACLEKLIELVENKKG